MIPLSIRLAVTCAVLGSLAACGGGSSGSDGASADAGTAAAVSPTTSAARGFHHQSERVSLAAASYAAPAIGGTITVTVDRLDGSTGAASVGFATADGTAVAGTDYTATNGRLSWASGDASPKTFNVKVADNTSTSKSFQVQLADPTGVSLGSVTSASVTIAAAATTSGSSSGGSSSGGTGSSSSSGSSGSSGSSSGSSSGTTTAPSGTFWVYYNGVFAWPGDYSFEAVPNYQDTSGAPLSGDYDIKVSVTGAWGGFQPFATNWDFDTTPYGYLTFALKPTVANMQAQVYFMQVGDIPVGNTVNVFQYGPAPVVGQWGVYKIPLSVIGVADIHVYKFAIQDQTGLSTDVFYLDNIGFLPAGS